MNSQAIQINIDENRKYISMLLFFWVLGLFFLYIYFINSSVLDTIARQQNDKNIANLSSNIGILENEYMNARAGLNIDVARGLGFKDDFSKVHFSSENSNVAGTISLRGDEI